MEGLCLLYLTDTKFLMYSILYMYNGLTHFWLVMFFFSWWAEKLLEFED